jgi:uncharacterized protein YhfF
LVANLRHLRRVDDEAAAEVVQAFWDEAADALGLPGDSPYLAGPIARCDATTPAAERAMIDELADLAARHLKRGTCHLALEFALEDTPVRRVGDHWVILRADGAPTCVVRMIAIHTLPFDRVGPEFAACEGPEAGQIPSHANWWRAHREYFETQCAGWGIAYSDDLPVVCESFITVYSPAYPVQA